MKDSGAVDFLWAEGFATAVYVINQTTSTYSGNITPFEAFFSKKPDVSHMRVWYSDVYTHQPKNLGAVSGNTLHGVPRHGFAQKSNTSWVYINLLHYPFHFHDFFDSQTFLSSHSL